jgi:NADPH-dependent glutamate synthase beta subunit-like oxidoreductase
MAVFGRTHRPVIDRELCQSCSICMRLCPAELMTELRQEQDTARGYIYRNTGLSNIKELPPCVAACPISQKVPEYIHLMEAGNVKEALLIIRQENPLPGVCGYVCHRPCENACLVGVWSAPVPIRELKKQAVQYELDHKDEIINIISELRQSIKGKNIIIVGAGPAGLSCGYELNMHGYDVTIMDAFDKPGGMLRAGIPLFRLPRHIIDHDVDIIRSLGVKFTNSVSIGKDISLDALNSGNADAVVLAVGNYKSIGLGLECEDAASYTDWLDFLKKMNMGCPVNVSGKVLVIGGGNVAIDVSRSALRAGAKSVEVLSLEKEDEMPADPFEIKTAKEEGINIRFEAVPIDILMEKGRVKGLTCAPASLGWDETGRVMPKLRDGKPFDIECDHIISAIGQVAELSFMRKEGISKKETIRLNEGGTVMGYEGRVFAAGDALTGPSSVVEAIASGKSTARLIIDHVG